MKIFSKIKKNKKENKGFIILFSIIIISIILSIALGIGSIAFQEINFNISSKDSHQAFFNADLGVECALYYDVQNKFPKLGPSEIINCANKVISPTYLGNSSYKFVIPGLIKGCAIVEIVKDNDFTVIYSKGYNIGDINCATTSPRRIEQSIKVTYENF